MMVILPIPASEVNSLRKWVIESLYGKGDEFFSVGKFRLCSISPLWVGITNEGDFEVCWKCPTGGVNYCGHERYEIIFNTLPDTFNLKEDQWYYLPVSAPDFTCPGLNDLASKIAQWRESQGFATPDSLTPPEEVLAKLMLVVTELSEAAEAVRHEDLPNFIEEIADTTIRILDLTGTMGINLEGAIQSKMEANVARPYKHGKVA